MALVPGERRAGDDQVGGVVRQGSSSKKPWLPGRDPRLGLCQLPTENAAQGLGGLNRNDLPGVPRELKRQATRARPDLDNPPRPRGSHRGTSGWSRSALTSRS